MTSKLLKRLNNEITIWENVYGEYYSYLYNADGSLRVKETDEASMFENLKVARTVMEVLQKLKRNRFNDIKRLEIKRYVIGE